METSNSARQTLGGLVLLLGVTIGCGGGAEQLPATPVGPHGGHTALMSEGAAFEMEFTLDERGRRMVVYVQEPGGSRPYPLRVDELGGRFEADGRSLEVTFTADPRHDDPEGHASRFALPLNQVPQQLLASDQFVLRFSYAADGNAVTASIPHKNDHAHEYHHD